MRKTAILITAMFLFGIAPAILAQTPTVQELLLQVQTLQDQIQSLQSQIQNLQAQQTNLGREIQPTVKQLARVLDRGMSGADVRALQEFFSTDSTIYPERIITGFFGPLTEQAVQRFQTREQIVSSGSPRTTGYGRVGPRTLARVNELLAENAGKSGVVPTGLPTAPGIAELDFIPGLPSGSVFPPEIIEQFAGTVAAITPLDLKDPPVISGVTSTTTGIGVVVVTWATDKLANGKVYYDSQSPVVVGPSTQMVSDSVLREAHALAIQGLETNTRYYYLLTSTDEIGNTTTSSEQSVTTSSE